MNGRSFSGVAEFAAIAKTNNRGIFIGEECGGGYHGNSSGDEAMVTLPYTQITARIPLIKYTMAVKNEPYKDGGIHTDYPIDLTITDLIAHTDSQLEYALRLLQKIYPINQIHFSYSNINFSMHLVTHCLHNFEIGRHC